jgi:hypothetical protein
LWSIGRYDLRLNDEEFWGLTLREFNLLMKRHKEQRSAEMFNSALICATIANVNRSKGRAYTPQDFMPKEKEKKIKMKIEDMLSVLKAVTASNGGDIKC